MVGLLLNNVIGYTAIRVSDERYSNNTPILEKIFMELDIEKENDHTAVVMLGLEDVCMFIFGQLCLLKDLPTNDIPPICEEMTCLSF